MAMTKRFVIGPVQYDDDDDVVAIQWAEDFYKKHPRADGSHIGMVPDTSEGAFVGCDCTTCREARLRDEDRIVYGAHDLAAAYRQGYQDALMRVLERFDAARLGGPGV
jgi:ABC-type sugar transport system substrate-binding protein